ncbi:MAG: UPF0223 family protein [Acholeplasmataceae bacterium]|nr:UPF0223 family protein [Acholeplasmataceae bacterium]HOA63526.1 UPF0223 family protein [Bacilli bacterium]HPT89292.1 UPF0223 family protein [Bacilli bacterium]HQA19625.1 UPF0223 family protein [Bacilli bacterium]HQD91691.1 UPF0223 family protein [Bacilli bacterium]
MNNEYKIDYDMFTAQEIVQIINFFRLIEKTKYQKVDPDLLKTKYNEYRNILRNKALEKQYDKMLYEKSNVSIYQVIKSLK